MLTIREATPDDAADFARLFTALNDTVGADSLPPGLDRLPENVLMTEKQARRRLRATAAIEPVFIAEVQGAAVGFVAVRLIPYLGQDVPWAEVTQLYVAPERRRLRVARALMAHAEELARARRCTSLHVITGHDNAPANALYAAAGYEELYAGFEKFLKPSR